MIPLETDIYPAEGKKPHAMEKMMTRNIAIRNEGSAISEMEIPEMIHPMILFRAPITERGIEIPTAIRSENDANESVTGTLWAISALTSWPDTVLPHSPCIKEMMKLQYLSNRGVSRPLLALYDATALSPASSVSIYAELSPLALSISTKTSRDTARNAMITTRKYLPSLASTNESITIRLTQTKRKTRNKSLLLR